MPTTDHDRQHEVLGPPECLRLLATAAIGRLAFTRAALPAIQPVSFSLRGEDLLIPAPPTSPLVDAVHGSIVAFETDDYDRETRTGWAVTVVGHARVLDGRGADSRTVHPAFIAVQIGLLEGQRTALPR